MIKDALQDFLQMLLHISALFVQSDAINAKIIKINAFHAYKDTFFIKIHA